MKKLKNKSRYTKKNRYKSIDIIVIRVSKNGLLGMSKPCKHCIIGMLNIPKKYGFKIENILYSDKNGNIIKTTLNELVDEKQHISKFYRR